MATAAGPASDTDRYAVAAYVFGFFEALKVTPSASKRPGSFEHAIL